MSRFLSFRFTCSLCATAVASSVMSPTVMCASETNVPAVLPVDFIANVGQWPEATRFVSRLRNMTACLEDNAVELHLRGAKGEDAASLRLQFQDSSQDVELQGENPSQRSYNFFRGPNRHDWQENVRAYRSVVYRGLYDGVDLRLRLPHDRAKSLEYDLLLGCGADIETMRIHCDGAESMEIDQDGTLVMNTAAGPVLQPAPTTWYELPTGERRFVSCRYRIFKERSFGFELMDAHLDYPLVVDPLVTYFGGGGDDFGFAIAVDAVGNVIVGGDAAGFDLPTSACEVEPGGSGPNDAFVCKFSADLTELQWVAVLGGSGGERVIDLKVDVEGRVTVVGLTDSPDFPVSEGAFEESHGGGMDAFVARLDPNCELEFDEQLLYSTYLGGRDDDFATAVEISEDGRDAYITGCTRSDDFPVSEGSYDGSLNGGFDSFLLHLITDMEVDPEEQLLYATYLGGSGSDCNSPDNNIYFAVLHQNLALEPDGSVLVAGTTDSGDFPTTEDAFDTTANGERDIYVVHLRPDATLLPEEQLLAATRLGGSRQDVPSAVGRLNNGDVVVVGSTQSTSSFPTDTPGRPCMFQTNHGDAGSASDTIIARFTQDLSELSYSTFYGGNSGDRAWTARIDPSGQVAMCGRVFGSRFPTSDCPIRLSKKGVSDCFFALLDLEACGADQLLYATPFGGNLEEGAWSIAVNGSQVYMTGWTTSRDFTGGMTPGGFDEDFNGISDAWVVRFDAGEFECPPDGSQQEFRRGDCNDDGTVDLSDAVATLGFLFLGDGEPGCDDACDSNDDGLVDTSDPITTLGALFLGNPQIPDPGIDECGLDPTEDARGCETARSCGE